MNVQNLRWQFHKLFFYYYYPVSRYVNPRPTLYNTKQHSFLQGNQLTRNFWYLSKKDDSRFARCELHFTIHQNVLQHLLLYESPRRVKKRY